MGPIPGEAGVDFPVYNSVPDTGFDCAAQDNPGIYTDTEADCQVPNTETVRYFLKSVVKYSSHDSEFCKRSKTYLNFPGNFFFEKNILVVKIHHSQNCSKLNTG